MCDVCGGPLDGNGAAVSDISLFKPPTMTKTPQHVLLDEFFQANLLHSAPPPFTCFSSSCSWSDSRRPSDRERTHGSCPHSLKHFDGMLIAQS